MHFNKLDLNLLVALDHMLTLKSVSRAAEHMNLTQSAMSNALTRLRSYFDDPLLVQVGRRMELTPRAQAIKHSVRDILVRIEATVATDLTFDPSQSTRDFRIILSDFTMSTLMPKVLELADRESSRIRFQLLPQIESPYQAIEKGDADVLVAPGPLTSSEHPSEHLFSEEYVCITCASSHHHGRSMTQERYVEARHVQMVPTRGGATFEQQWLEHLGVQRDVALTSYTFTSLPHLIIGSERIATIHKHLALHYQSLLAIDIHPLPFDIPLLEERIQWHAYRDQDPGIRWLTNLMHSAASTME
ncbi:LysR family transcriptional regulator [Chromohalobacter marismortui]|uniref:LysR family transcriptional regulator n=1 Tax=Chromohalobacter marismortui TaxID=42055 RepID=A0A4R7NML8_9GAMM|nr:MULTISPECIES: LysR family transcriptional regulator [Chromohalobacter]MCI0509657.1 LysR family transcriptional regulator [Chromohalobacter sp.]MCI0593668.1 LysR family transcriptional regulator [Chromohalobacter sp.]TDU21878.1 LysR family transcriptional regulator [Chromohalobacter marismortui]